MHTLRLEVEDSQLDVVLNIIKSLKNDIISKYEIINENIEQKDFIKLSEKSLSKVWDNQDDCVYDKYLKERKDMLTTRISDIDSGRLSTEDFSVFENEMNEFEKELELKYAN
jgi:hypothetical protein